MSGCPKRLFDTPRKQLMIDGNHFIYISISYMVAQLDKNDPLAKPMWLDTNI